MIYPNINPIALDLNFIQIYWYGIMYLFAFLSAYFLAQYRAKKSDNWSSEQIEDLVLYGGIGVVLGGRLGYMLFYNLSTFISDPLTILAIQDGGMSFHGGFLGVALALYLFNKKYDKGFFTTSDFVVPLIPLGLFFGRIGNFINNELWGAQTNSYFGMYLPMEQISRHPSQLYEALLEGLVLFLILWIYSSSPRAKAKITATFLIFYGLFRFLVEFVRMPDEHIGYLAFEWLTMGHLLTAPMIIYGIYLLGKNYRNVISK
jgi:phosphatidylglycerol:prolipoprotein diacylglycerol transferase